MNDWGGSTGWGAPSGPAYVVLIMTGNSIAEPGEPAHASGAQVLAQLQEQAGSTAAQIGISMELLGFAAFAFFLGWLTTALRREANRAPWLATAVLVGGASTLAVKIGSVFPELALGPNRGSVDESTARLVADMGSAGFVLSFLTFGIFMLATGLAGPTLVSPVGWPDGRPSSSERSGSSRRLRPRRTPWRRARCPSSWVCPGSSRSGSGSRSAGPLTR